jgi:hypothetical protein
MNKRVLLLMTVGVTIGLPVSAFAQAAAESALTNALSSSATIKAGSSLNRALDQGSNRLGVRIQERTSSPVRSGGRSGNRIRELQNPAAAPQSGGSAYSGSTSGIGALSIRGGEVACASPDAGSPASPAKSGAGTASTNCRNQGLPSESRAEEKYKSFVTLPPPK